MFNCDCCGLCCMNLKKSSLFNDLDRGDGICIYFDIGTKLCTIYSHRPVKCNVDKLFKLFFKGKITKEQYYQLNYSACKKLKEEGKRDVFSNVK